MRFENESLLHLREIIIQIFAGIVLEGGIIGYDANLESGGSIDNIQNENVNNLMDINERLIIFRNNYIYYFVLIW